ncbi:MAG TPA: hypothetical protein VF552_15620 [Allosphingosinicella sp.]|jgi:hypothetical protein
MSAARQGQTAGGASEAVPLPLLGIAGGLLGFLLFGILYVLTDAAPVLVAGCGGALLLLAVSVAARDRTER